MMRQRTPRERATHVDDSLGIREEAEFFTVDDEELFGIRSLPPGIPLGGVLICSPILGEFGRNYRREVEVARRLAANGLAVQRFHYRGMGNSSGQLSRISVDTIVRDAMVAGNRLCDETGVRIVAVIGTRIGAWPAQEAANRFRSLGLVLCEPVLHGSTYLRTGMRSALFHALRQQRLNPKTTRSTMKELLESGSVDLLGHSLHKRLAESILAYDVAEAIDQGPRQILWIDAPRGTQEKQVKQRLLRKFEASGMPVTLTSVSSADHWWLVEGGPLRPSVSDVGLEEPTLSWIMRLLSREEP
jgi:pimeloyl-ACP methyl ester carboxylesterase